jgi:hypothetical protein
MKARLVRIPASVTLALSIVTASLAQTAPLQVTYYYLPG